MDRTLEPTHETSLLSARLHAAAAGMRASARRARGSLQSARRGFAHRAVVRGDADTLGRGGVGDAVARDGEVIRRGMAEPSCAVDAAPFPGALVRSDL